MSYNNLMITIEQAESIAVNFFGIKGKTSKLPGEVDFNFRIKIENNLDEIEFFCVNLLKENDLH